MDVRNAFSREKFINGLKSVGKLRIKTNHDSLITISALLVILFVAFGIRLFPMRWEIQTGKMHLSEFDGYFQYRFTEYMVKNGYISWAWPTQWNDTQRWFPHGINVATAGFPGLPLTAAFLYNIFTALGANIDLMGFCALLPAFLGMLASLVIFFLGKDMGGKPMGLLAALFLALSPSYIQRSSLGWFDDEIIGILSLLLFVFLFLRAIEDDRAVTSSAKYSIGAGVVLGYFCAGWGAYYYPIGVVVLFTFVLIILRKYTQRLFLSYSLTFGLGLFIAALVPKITPSFLTTIAILPAAMVFVLLGLSEVFRVVVSTKWRIVLLTVFLIAMVGGFAILWQLGYARSIAGKFISVLDPFQRAAAPLIESVAEHRLSSWGSIYYDFGVGILFFIAGLFFVLRNLNTRNLFLLIFGLTSLYFGGSMIRLIVLMAPAFSLMAAAGTVGIMKPFATLLKEPPRLNIKKKLGQEYVSKEFSGLAVIMIFLILMTNLAFPMPKVYKQVNSPITITAGSLPIAPNEPVREWLDMLEWTRNNLGSTTVVCSWWDYGYWLTVLGNVTSLADNATIDSDKIEDIGFIFMSNETTALRMLKRYNAKYILVFTTFDANGNWAGYGDEGKWMWMARISGKAYARFEQEKLIDEYSGWKNETHFGQYNSTQNKWIWNAVGMNTTVYKLMSFGKHTWLATQRPDAADPDLYSQPVYFKEAYFAGKALTSTQASKYGNLIPFVALYEVDWKKYSHDYPDR